MKIQFMNEPDDVQRLKDVHLKTWAPEFSSAVVYGNEDSPEKIELYATANPSINDYPVAVYRMCQVTCELICVG
jgi:hypothetical protein